MITCQDILELQLDGVELIAGEKGLTRPVTWTYMVQTRPFEEHMNQGNFAVCGRRMSGLTWKKQGKSWKNYMGLGSQALGFLSPMTKNPFRRR